MPEGKPAADIICDIQPDLYLAEETAARIQDFMVHLAVRDTAHLRDLALDAFTARPEVGQIETSLLYDHAVKPVLPNLNAMT